MMLICGQSNRVWHYWAGKYPGTVGVMLGPSYYTKVPIDEWMPFVLDNDAYKAWTQGTEWNVALWRAMIGFIRMKLATPLWVAIPDVVGNREKTLENWKRYSPEIWPLGWTMAFCVQDGMTPDDVPSEAGVVFVGGTDRWKFPNLKMWTDHFPRVHCARVNALEMIESCERLGCESIDGTGWFRDPSRPDKIPAIEGFIEGCRQFEPSLGL